MATKTKKRSSSPKFRMTHHVVTFFRRDITTWRKNFEEDKDATSDGIADNIVEDTRDDIGDFVREALECDPRDDVIHTIGQHIEEKHPRVKLFPSFWVDHKIPCLNCPECRKLRGFYKRAERDWFDGKL